MDLPIDKLEDAALRLPPHLRERLAKVLIGSLREDPDVDEQAVMDAWVEEAERRLREVENGTVETIPADQLIERVRQRIHENRNPPSG